MFNDKTLCLKLISVSFAFWDRKRRKVYPYKATHIITHLINSNQKCSFYRVIISWSKQMLIETIKNKPPNFNDSKTVEGSTEIKPGTSFVLLLLYAV